jgi:hypothetical protein
VRFIKRVFFSLIILLRFSGRSLSLAYALIFFVTRKYVSVSLFLVCMSVSVFRAVFVVSRFTSIVIKN